jgi:hypothetical protein
MSTGLQAVLEVVKYILPSIVVFLTVYYMMKGYLDNQLRLRSMEIQEGKGKDARPIRLQALERLALFCERIRISNLVMRLRTSSMTPEELGTAMLISIQKEFEHNLTQQIYISDSLWQIINLAKDQNIQVVQAALSKSGDFLDALGAIQSERGFDPVDQALSAIRKEITLYL